LITDLISYARPEGIYQEKRCVVFKNFRTDRARPPASLLRRADDYINMGPSTKSAPTPTNVDQIVLYRTAGLKTVQVNRWRRKCVADAVRPKRASEWKVDTRSKWVRSIDPGNSVGPTSEKKIGPAKLETNVRRVVTSNEYDATPL